MIKLLLFTIFAFLSVQCFSQTDPLIDSLLHKNTPAKKQTANTANDSLVRKNVTAKLSTNDSSPKKITPPSTGEANASTLTLNDSSIKSSVDSLQLSATDSTRNDSLKNVGAASQVAPSQHLSWQQDTLFTHLFNVRFNKKGAAVFLVEDERHFESKDFVFYALAGIMLLLGFIKLAFPKYFINIFRLFAESSSKQRQSRDAILQDNLPSLLTNILFFLSAGMFVTLIASYNQWMRIPLWSFFIYSTSVLAATYLLKFAFIKFSGWIFHAEDASENYISVVFLVNKLAGVLIIPLSLLIAFSENSYNEILITVGIAVFILLLLYRYIMVLSFLRSRYSIHPFHFFLYLCCVEIIPMLVIYKVLFNKVTGVF